MIKDTENRVDRNCTEDFLKVGSWITSKFGAVLFKMIRLNVFMDRIVNYFAVLIMSKHESKMFTMSKLFNDTSTILMNFLVA